MPDFKTILAAADDQDKLDLTIAYNAKVTAAKAYQERPGKATSEDRKAVDADYAELLARMVEKYFPEDTPAPEGERFSNRKQAFDWIKAQGYSVSRGKFYNDVSSGFPRLHKDKTISRFEVLQYCQQQDVERRGSIGDMTAAREEADTRKAIAEADRAELKRDQERRALGKNWFDLTTVYEREAALVGQILSELRYQLGKKAPVIIALCHGDQKYTVDINKHLEDVVFSAFRSLQTLGKIDQTFAADEEHD